MTSRIVIAGGAVACAVLAGALAALVLAGGDVPATPAEVVARPAGVRVGCERQSTAGVPGASGFRGAFTSRRNLVVGPLSLVGGGTFTDAATVRSSGGNKFPLLVKAGHRVTVSVPESHRAIAGLDYGFQPVPQHTLTFAGCSEGQARSRAGGPVTFWSGFVTTTVPACVPLDVWIDSRPRRRVAVSLGRECSGGR